MIKKKGNILDVLSPENVIAHGCNRQGVWGSGVAGQLKPNHPYPYSQYVKDCYEMVLGDVSFYTYPDGRTILSMFTQEYYGRNEGTRYVSYDAFDRCIRTALGYCVSEGKQLNIPYLVGAGLGGGNEGVILSIIDQHERQLDTQIVAWVYEK